MGVGLSRVWVMSASACVAASFDDIISNVRDTGKTMWYPRLSIWSSWRCSMLGRGTVASMA